MLVDSKQAAIGNGYSLGNDLAPVREACPRACGLCTSDFTMTVQMKVYDLDGNIAAILFILHSLFIKGARLKPLVYQ